MLSPFLYEPDPEIERTFRLEERSKSLSNKDARVEEPHQIWWEEEAAKEGHLGILLP